MLGKGPCCEDGPMALTLHVKRSIGTSSPLICDIWLAQVKDVASYVTSSHDRDGVAEAIERFLL